MRIAIIVAMDKEYEQLVSLFENNQDVSVFKSGIGKVNAALNVQNIVNNFHPDIIISSGCAGGHGDGVRPKDVVVSTEVCYHDVWCGKPNVLGQIQGEPLKFPVSQKAFSLATQDLKTDVRIHLGLIVTGDWFVDKKEKMKEIVRNFPDAVAVDMESAAVAHACYANGIEFISFRVISDCPLSRETPEQYDNFWADVADNSFKVTRIFVEKLIEENGYIG